VDTSGPAFTVTPVTVTVKLHEAVRPQPSVTLALTVVTPVVKVEPDGGVKTIFNGGTPPLVCTL